MSDVKPKRSPREPAPSEKPVATATPAIPAPPPPVEAELASEAVRAVVPPPPPAPPQKTDSPADPAADSWTALADAQAALARGFEAFSTEATALTRAGTAAVTDAALALLGARTFAEAIEINATLARRELDAVISGSAKLSEIGVTAWSEAAQPLWSRLGAGWD